MKIASTTRFIWCAAWLAAQVTLAAQTHFTDEAGISKFLHDHFDGANAGMVVGLLDASAHLKRKSADGKTMRRIVFEGERFDVMSVRRWRERVLGATGEDC